MVPILFRFILIDKSVTPCSLFAVSICSREICLYMFKLPPRRVSNIHSWEALRIVLAMSWACLSNKPRRPTVYFSYNSAAVFEGDLTNRMKRTSSHNWHIFIFQYRLNTIFLVFIDAGDNMSILTCSGDT